MISFGMILSAILKYSALFVGLFRYNFLTYKLEYLPSSVERTLLQWILNVVKSAVGVETGPSYEIFSSPTVSCTLWVLVFLGLMLHNMRLYVTLPSWRTSCLCMKKHVYVPSISWIPWKRRPI